MIQDGKTKKVGFLLNFTDQTRLLCCGDDVNNLTIFCVKHGRDDSAFSASKATPNLNVWKNLPLEGLYSEGVLEDYYSSLYQIYSTYLVEFLKQYETDRPLLLVEPGCGDGRCSKYISDTIERSNRKRPVYVVGFDINHINIGRAKATFDKDKQFFAHCGFDAMGEFFHESESFRTGINNPIIVVVFSGVLCALVSNGSREALQWVQKATRNLAPDLTIISGYTEILINKSTVSRVGLQMCARLEGPVSTYELPDKEIKIVNSVYFFTPRNREFHLQKLLAWGNKRSLSGKKNLDLSMSANPCMNLRQLMEDHVEYLHGVEQLDLSDILLEDNEIISLAELICASLPALTRILFMKTDKWHATLANRILRDRPQMKFNFRCDFADANLLPVVSIPLARDLGLFKSVPNQSWTPNSASPCVLNQPVSASTNQGFKSGNS